MQKILPLSLVLGGCLSAGGMPSNVNSTPAPVREISLKNAELETTAGVAAKEWGKTQGNPPPTILRAFVNDDDWTVERKVSGDPTLRHVRVVLDYKGGQTGACHRWHCQMNEDPQGGKWGPAYIQCQSLMMANATCDSIEAERGSPP